MAFSKRIAFEDAHVLVVNKLAGQFTQEASSATKKAKTQSLISEASSYLKERTKTKPYVGLVHRLDAPTSGLVILAKTKLAARVLSKDLQKRRVEKHYLAVINGALPIGIGQEQWLTDLVTVTKGGMIAPNGQRTQVVPTSGMSEDEHSRISNLPYVVSATLAYTPLAIRSINKDTERKQTAVHVKLITGRKHQIRAQFAAMGHPVVGDARYGASQRFKERDIALHAYAIAFYHPVNRTSRTVVTSSISNNNLWTSRFGAEFVDEVNASLESVV